MYFTFNYLCVRVQGEQLQSGLVPHPRLYISSALRRRKEFPKSIFKPKKRWICQRHCLRDLHSVGFIIRTFFFVFWARLEIRLHILTDQCRESGGTSIHFCAL